ISLSGDAWPTSTSAAKIFMAVTPIFLRTATGRATVSKLGRAPFSWLRMAALSAIWVQSNSWRSSAVLRTSGKAWQGMRSEEHTSELQSLRHLVCRLLLGKKTQIRRVGGDRGIHRESPLVGHAPPGV